MNIAVIFAGGVGVRMRSNGVPKQFLKVYDKPILIHTLEKFQFCPSIDAIVIACLESHIEYTQQLCRSYSIDKVRAIVPGGQSGQESIYHGLLAAKKVAGEDDAIVLIHDGVRPVIDSEIINANIESVEAHGSAITAAVCKETIAMVNDEGKIVTTTDRSCSRRACAPQSFYLRDILDAHERARSEGRDGVIDSCTMMTMYGHELYTVECDGDNIKITTPDDLFMFKAILEYRQNYLAF